MDNKTLFDLIIACECSPGGSFKVKKSRFEFTEAGSMYRFEYSIFRLLYIYPPIV